MDLKGEQIGKLRHRVEILQPTEVATDYGNPKVTGFTTLALLWANFEMQSGGSGEEVDAGMQITTTMAMVKLRYRTDITTEMRVKYDDKEYAILRQIHDPHKRFTFLQVEFDSTVRDV